MTRPAGALGRQLQAASSRIRSIRSWSVTSLVVSVGHQVPGSGGRQPCVDHPDHLGAQCGQPGHFRVELIEAPLEQVLGRLARADPQPLPTLDEPHAAGGTLVAS